MKQPINSMTEVVLEPVGFDGTHGANAAMTLGNPSTATSVWVRLKGSLAFRPEAGAFVATLAVFVIFSLWAENFLTFESFTSIVTLAAEAGIIAMGVTLLMISGEFDLSVGSVLGLTACLVPFMMNAGIPSWIAVLVALAVAVGIGLLQGLATIKVGLPSFIVTLAGLMWWRGVVFVLTGGFPISVNREDAFFQILSHRFGNGINVSALWFLGLACILTMILQRTQFGNWIFATGGNRRAARELGVPVDRVKLLLFGLTAGLAGLAGIIQMARFLSVDALRGDGVELNAIAAAAIGGTRLRGGHGSVVGTVLGVLMVAMIQNGLILARTPGYWFRAFVGVLIVIAVVINTITERRSLRRGEGDD